MPPRAAFWAANPTRPKGEGRRAAPARAPASGSFPPHELPLAAEPGLSRAQRAASSLSARHRGPYGSLRGHTESGWAQKQAGISTNPAREASTARPAPGGNAEEPRGKGSGEPQGRGLPPFFRRERGKRLQRAAVVTPPASGAPGGGPQAALGRTSRVVTSSFSEIFTSKRSFSSSSARTRSM